MRAMSLVPMPKRVQHQGGHWRLPRDVYVVIDPHEAVRDLFAGEDFCRAAKKYAGRSGGGAGGGGEGTRFHVTVSHEAIAPKAEIRVRFEPAISHEQGYQLTIAKDGITLAARTKPGVFYAFQTLLQILRNAAAQGLSHLPCTIIEDWPDFPSRGFYHDISRGKVPTLDTLLHIVEDLGRLKYNEFQLYVENVFEFRRHPAMYDDTTPLTASEILRIDAACRERHIEFVPSMASLGHFDKILKRPAYRHLAEAEPADLKKAGITTWCDDPWTLCVTDPAAKTLLKEMVDEFVPNFTSAQFNICCDESWDLGKGRSKPLADEIGVGKLYIDWINFCADLAQRHGKRIQMWGDIILNHPELIAQLPADATLLEWGYESHHAFDEHLKLFAERTAETGKNFYAAPGTASWLSLASRTRNALGNIANAARAGLKHGATGLLVTDWGDHGHQQLWAVSMLPLAYGAAAGWNVAACVDPSIRETPNWQTGIIPAGNDPADRKLQPFLHAASLHLFGDDSGKIAALAYSLGLTYERFTWQRFNGSLDWFLFREKWDVPHYINRVEPGDLDRVKGACERFILELEALKSHRADGKILIAELLLTARTILHVCKRTALRIAWLAAAPAQRNATHEAKRTAKPRRLPPTFKPAMALMAKDARALKKDFSALWRKRNKESRLQDLRAEFRRLREEYKQFA
jgi:hypothetical protein